MPGSSVQFGPEGGAYYPDGTFEIYIRGTQDRPTVYFPTWDDPDSENGEISDGVIPLDGNGDLTLENVLVVSEVPGADYLMTLHGPKVFTEVDDVRDLLGAMMKEQDVELARIRRRA